MNFLRSDFVIENDDKGLTEFKIHTGGQPIDIQLNTMNSILIVKIPSKSFILFDLAGLIKTLKKSDFSHENATSSFPLDSLILTSGTNEFSGRIIIENLSGEGSQNKIRIDAISFNVVASILDKITNQAGDVFLFFFPGIGAFEKMFG